MTLPGSATTALREIVAGAVKVWPPLGAVIVTGNSGLPVPPPDVPTTPGVFPAPSVVPEPRSSFRYDPDVGPSPGSWVGPTPGKPDPLLQAWKNAFPGIIRPETAIPSALLPHMRYPTDLFEVQREILAQYHVSNPQSFYGGQNFWTIPNDPTGVAANQHSQPPYYLTETIPGYRQPEFSLTTTFVPRNRANLAAVMTVDSNPGPGYGTIRVLQLPQNAVTEGPSQVQGAFESNAVASAELTPSSIAIAARSRSHLSPSHGL